MKRLRLALRNWVVALLYPRPLIGLIYFPRFVLHWIKYSQSSPELKIGLLELQPCLGDWSTHTPFEAHYFYQGAWLARRVRSTQIDRHVDVGSSVLGISVLSAFVDTTFVDFRPLNVSLPGLTSLAGNILALPFADNTICSVSCLHVIEHIGLGRYGDPIDPQGSVKAALELQRIVSSGGQLFLSVPIGRERVCFNAHRVHAAATVVRMFSQMSLVEFSFVDDAGQYHDTVQITDTNNLEYGCGLFQFKKP